MSYQAALSKAQHNELTVNYWAEYQESQQLFQWKCNQRETKPTKDEIIINMLFGASWPKDIAEIIIFDYVGFDQLFRYNISRGYSRWEIPEHGPTPPTTDNEDEDGDTQME